jgi:hypothetical protein
MMKTLLLSLLLLPLVGLSQNTLDKIALIRVEQDGTFYTVEGQEITLRKQPFKVLVTLQSVEGVYLYAGFTDSIYKLEAGQKIPDFQHLPAMTMAEATFNEDQELMISTEGWAYWFYDKKSDWHRFDKKLEILKGGVIGTKTIKQFYFPATEKTMKVADVTEPLYLFFVAVDKENKNGEPEKELLRAKIKINWQ